MVTRKQGCIGESELKERKLEEDLEMGVHGRKRRSGEDPGKIHRSVGVRCSGVLKGVGVRRAGVRTSEGESFGCLVGVMRVTGEQKGGECPKGSDEGD